MVDTYRQSENPNPVIPTHRNTEEKGKTIEDKKERVVLANKRVLALVFKSASRTPSNMGSPRSFHRDTD